MRSHSARWLFAVLAVGACDHAALPEPVAPESRTSRASTITDASVASVAGPASGLVMRPGAGGVAPVANMPPGTACPPHSFVNDVNYSTNPSFESGVSTSVSGPPTINSAATGWKMHTNNSGASITTARVATIAPGPSGSRTMAVFAGGNEGGIYQNVRTPSKVMFSAWVWVNTGQVVIGTHAMVHEGPSSWSTKTQEWEQLRVCTDGSSRPDWFSIYNQNPAGGSFYVDRVEIRAIP